MCEWEWPASKRRVSLKWIHITSPNLAERHTHTIFWKCSWGWVFECINAQMDARSYRKFKLVFKDKEQRGSEGFTSGFLSQTMSFFYQLVEILPQCLSLMEPFSAQAEKAEYEVVHLFFLCGICLPSVELQRRFVTFIIAVVMASLGLKAITTAGPSRTKHSQIIF